MYTSILHTCAAADRSAVELVLVMALATRNSMERLPGTAARHTGTCIWQRKQQTVEAVCKGHRTLKNNTEATTVLCSAKGIDN